ncbi:MAG: WYL domain-containing protein, partial [Actinomycetaceae bacterium]|nr:WYL domain-containing protein [Actinomycetaceae bacterium]
SFSLAELILIIHTLDELLEVTPPSRGRIHLSEIRDALAFQACERGYGNVIWERAGDIISTDMLDTIIRALDDGYALDLHYSTFDEGNCAEKITQYKVVPLRLDGGARPALQADLYGEQTGIRTLRLDRICGVRMEGKVPRQRITQARERLKNDDCDKSYIGAPCVTIHATREALWAAEELPGLSLEEHGDELVMTIPARNYDFIARYVALMGRSVRSIEPAEVAERVHTIFTALATSYADNGTSTAQ